MSDRERRNRQNTQGKVVTDPRFAAVQWDPRFQRFPRARNKVEVDERFAGMFKDPAFQVQAGRDKRGRKVKSSKHSDDMRRYYRLKDEDDWEEKPSAPQRESQQAHHHHEEQKERQAKLGDSGDESFHTAASSGTESDSEGEEEEEDKLYTADGKKGAQSSDSENDSGDDKPAASPILSESEGQDDDEVDDDDDDDQARARERWMRMRGLGGPETSSSSDGDDDDDDDDKETFSEEEEGDGKERFRLAGDGAGTMQSSDEDDDGDDVMQAAVDEWGVGAMAANPLEPVPLLPDATRRLAVVDLDWEHLSAVDILAALRSFVPAGKSIERVTVYPSDYGLERMAAEAAAGPQGVWKRRDRDRAANDDHDDDIGVDGEELPENPKTNGDDEDGERSSSEESGSGSEEEEEEESGSEGEVDLDRVHQYERSKLRWYYAVAEFDTAATANAVYEECDGMEFMKSACKFDLRFIPYETSFDGRTVRDTATDIPSDYVPPVFQTKALQHTNVQLTWDKGDDTRRRALTRKLTDAELREDDFKAYLASSASEDDSDSDQDGMRHVGEGSGDGEHGGDEAHAIRERYRRLLLGGDGGVDKGGDKGAAEQRKGKKDWVKDDVDEDDDVDEGDDVDGVVADRDMEMEVTFDAGLEGLAERLVEKRKAAATRAGETVWDAYLRRKREKKAELRRLGKVTAGSDTEEDSDPDPEDNDRWTSGEEGDIPAGVADDPFFQQEENPFDDPFFKDGPGSGEAPTGGDAFEPKNKTKHKAMKKGNGTEACDGSDGGGVEERGTSKKGGNHRTQAAELEMLLMDEDVLRQGRMPVTGAADGARNGKVDNAVAKVSKKERMRLLKEKKRKERTAGSDDEDAGLVAEFTPDLEDPRFANLFKSADFALDPTDPRFAKAGKGAATLAAEVGRRRSRGGGEPAKRKQGKDKATVGAATTSEKRSAGATDGANGAKADLRLMVASLKRKASAQGPNSKGKGDGQKKEEVGKGNRLGDVDGGLFGGQVKGKKKRKTGAS